ncbi:RSRC1 protein, partial [Polypterus senegalus]|nr:RSRC1 protein [Polypterus senegalus]
MQMVLQAAARTDEVLKAKEKKEEEAKKKKEEEQTTLADQVKRVKEIEDIESDSFVSQTFKSSRETKKSAESTEVKQDLKSLDLSVLLQKQDLTIPTMIQYQEDDDLAHPSLFIDKDEAEARWIKRLTTLRQERLMGSPVF